MTQLQDAMKDVRAKLDSIDPAHIAAIDSALSDLKAANDSLKSLEQADADTIAKHTASIDDVVEALAILTSPSVQPSPTPDLPPAA